MNNDKIWTWYYTKNVEHEVIKYNDQVYNMLRRNTKMYL